MVDHLFVRLSKYGIIGTEFPYANKNNAKCHLWFTFCRTVVLNRGYLYPLWVLEGLCGGLQNDLEIKYILNTFTSMYSVHCTDTIAIFVLN